MQIQSHGDRSRRSQVKEQDDWEKDLKPGGKYYFTRLVSLRHTMSCAPQ